MSTFVVRPTNSEKEVFRVRLTAASLLALKLKPGDLCQIRTSHHAENGETTSSPVPNCAIAWDPSGQAVKDGTVQMSKFLQDLYGCKLGEKITITGHDQKLRDTELISLRLREPVELSEDARAHWEWYIREIGAEASEYMAVGQRLDLRLGNVVKLQLVVTDIGISGTNLAKVTEQSNFKILTGNHQSTSSTISFDSSSLGGLQSQVAQMQKIIDGICHSIVTWWYRRYRPVQGVLLYGARGTGKSTFIDALSQSGWASVTKWTPGSKMVLSPQPQLVVLNSRHLLPQQNRIMEEIQTLFDAIRGHAVLVVAETQHPNDIDQSLRSDSQFGVEIELPIPNAIQRAEILKAICGSDEVSDDPLFREMAERTHGYVGADLNALLRYMVDLVSAQSSLLEINGHHEEQGYAPISEDEIKRRTFPTTSDLNAALAAIRPTALQEIFLEKPNVHWTDIGGQHEIKRQLQNAVERPLKHAALMAKLGLRPKKGILLYGPPGCSKTLLVRALATEADLNFLAVKGAELVSMYVGESERATREVFRKARAASPCIVFFDEIDAIASRSHSESGSRSSDLNVLTTLLNEMDGFEELRNVLVVAATNKPQDIDPALLRPGRFDNVVYIGPPDLEARKEIFEKKLQNVEYRSVEVDQVHDGGMPDVFEKTPPPFWSTSKKMESPAIRNLIPNLEQNESASLPSSLPGTGMNTDGPTASSHMTQFPPVEVSVSISNPITPTTLPLRPAPQSQSQSSNTPVTPVKTPTVDPSTIQPLTPFTKPSQSTQPEAYDFNTPPPLPPNPSNSSIPPSSSLFQNDISQFSMHTTGFSGAEIVSICQTAGELAMDDSRDYITTKDVWMAIRSTPKSISREMVGEFEVWGRARMR